MEKDTTTLGGVVESLLVDDDHSIAMLKEKELAAEAIMETETIDYIEISDDDENEGDTASHLIDECHIARDIGGDVTITCDEDDVATARQKEVKHNTMAKQKMDAEAMAEEKVDVGEKMKETVTDTQRHDDDPPTTTDTLPPIVDDAMSQDDRISSPLQIENELLSHDSDAVLPMPKTNRSLRDTHHLLIEKLSDSPNHPALTQDLATINKPHEIDKELLQNEAASSTSAQGQVITALEEIEISSLTTDTNTSKDGELKTQRIYTATS